MHDPVNADQLITLNLVESRLQRKGISADFLCRRVLDVHLEQICLVGFIMGGSHILNLGTVVGSLQGKRIDQNVLLGMVAVSLLSSAK